MTSRSFARTRKQNTDSIAKAPFCYAFIQELTPPINGLADLDNIDAAVSQAFPLQEQLAKSLKAHLNFSSVGCP